MNTQHKKTRSGDRFSKDAIKNDFISDGGMMERSKKYYNSTTFNKIVPPKSKFLI